MKGSTVNDKQWTIGRGFQWKHNLFNSAMVLSSMSSKLLKGTAPVNRNFGSFHTFVPSYGTINKVHACTTGYSPPGGGVLILRNKSTSFRQRRSATGASKSPVCFSHDSIQTCIRPFQSGFISRHFSNTFTRRTDDGLGPARSR